MLTIIVIDCLCGASKTNFLSGRVLGAKAVLGDFCRIAVAATGGQGQPGNQSKERC